MAHTHTHTHAEIQYRRTHHKTGACTRQNHKTNKQYRHSLHQTEKHTYIHVYIHTRTHTQNRHTEIHTHSHDDARGRRQTQQNTPQNHISKERVYVCVCVCVREREREEENETTQKRRETHLPINTAPADTGTGGETTHTTTTAAQQTHTKDTRHHTEREREKGTREYMSGGVGLQESWKRCCVSRVFLTPTARVFFHSAETKIASDRGKSRKSGATVMTYTHTDRAEQRIVAAGREPECLLCFRCCGCLREREVMGRWRWGI